MNITMYSLLALVFVVLMILLYTSAWLRSARYYYTIVIFWTALVFLWILKFEILDSNTVDIPVIIGIFFIYLGLLYFINLKYLLKQRLFEQADIGKLIKSLKQKTEKSLAEKVTLILGPSLLICAVLLVTVAVYMRVVA